MKSFIVIDVTGIVRVIKAFSFAELRNTCQEQGIKPTQIRQA